LTSLGFDAAALVAAGLVAPSNFPPRRAFGGARLSGGAASLPPGPGAPHGYYELFRGRLTVPVRDAMSGGVVGFGARQIDGASSSSSSSSSNDKDGSDGGSKDSSSGGGPKYLNSPDTPLFRKAKLLFGLHEAKLASRASSGRLALGAAGSGLCLVKSK
jgi:DNA primase